ncbi:hypothetical protein GN956_G8800 [Arapaima gigas]
MILDGHYRKKMVSNSPKASGSNSMMTGSVNGSPNVHPSFYWTSKVGNYLLGKKLGEGSFAKVREGVHTVTGEKVAIKVMDKRKVLKDSYMAKNLRREEHIQQMVHHPNIVQLLDVFETENNYYLVMELCTGGSIMDQLLKKNRLEELEVRKYVWQLVVAVKHLHQAGVAHRDLKVENILLDENDNVKLTDFGLSNCAKMLGYTDPFSTQCGSPAYAAPELLSQKKYGPKVDVWSIGVNMYIMLTGTLPFNVEPFNFRSLLQKMVDRDMNPLPPYLSPAAVNFLNSLLEPDPTRRPDIHQVISDPWLHVGNPQPNKILLEEVNHKVVLHMAEQMGYQYTEVMKAVSHNRACHTLAVYVLLDKKYNKLTRVHQEKQCNASPWKKLANKTATSPKQTPTHIPMKRDPVTEKKHKEGLQMVSSSVLKNMGSCFVLPNSPQSVKCQETWPLENSSSYQLEPKLCAATTTSVHRRRLAFKELHKLLSDPWYKLVNRNVSAPRQPFSFQPYKPYLNKVLASSPSAAGEPHGITARSHWACSDSSNGSRTRQENPKRQVRLPFMNRGNIL